MIKKNIIHHFKKNDGGIPGFGEIKNYLIKFSNDHSKSFDIKGNPLTNTNNRDTIGRPGNFYIDGENIGTINKIFKQ